MNLAIIGSSGYIARFLNQNLADKDSIKSILKVDCTGEIDAFVNLSEPEKFNYELLDDVDLIIFTAAVSSPDLCANNFEACWRINVDGTTFFIEEAIKRKCKVLFFSSDAVFGEDRGVFTENSTTNPLTAYGKMKKSVEDYFRGNSLFKAVRLSYVVSSQDKFLSYCLDCIKDEKEAEIFHPFYRNCITINDVLSSVIWFIDNWNIYDSWVLNIAGSELISRIRISDEINRILNGRLRYKIIYPNKEFFKNRPSVTQMESIYNRFYKIYSEESFSLKLQQELEEVNL